jgi:hypothetical protein
MASQDSPQASWTTLLRASVSTIRDGAMPAAELAGPADYSPLWLALGIALPLLVVAWYALVTWWASGFARPGPRGPSPRAVRRTHLAQIDAIERDAASGAMSPRAAHRGLSEVLRSYAAAVGEPAARSRTLTQLRRHGPGPVAEVVEVTYPPEFAPEEDGRPAERLPEAIVRAREVVSTWRP